MSYSTFFGITYLTPRTVIYQPADENPSDTAPGTHLKKRAVENKDKSQEDVDKEIKYLKKRIVTPEEAARREKVAAIDTLIKNYTKIKPENECFLVSDLRNIVANPSKYSEELVKAAKYYINNPDLYTKTDCILDGKSIDGYISLVDLTTVKKEFTA